MYVPIEEILNQEIRMYVHMCTYVCTYIYKYILYNNHYICGDHVLVCYVLALLLT